MVKISRLHAKDRVIIYKILQQNEFLDQKEIELELARVDEALFNKSNSKIWVVVAANNTQPIAGYASYGVDPGIPNAFVIFNIILSPLAGENGIEETLLDYIEWDIRRKKGQLILTHIPATSLYEPKVEFFTEHQYSHQFYESNADLHLMAKKI